ncbi:MAG: peptidylprolyl isomerase [Spirochaetaceae bacterium]|jgi:peptidyl-prolyl cis-trans isomerase B (cyclophilin B)|nr:peptidylprolyl isomerase [Spirochaetaceae bacterium]
MKVAAEIIMEPGGWMQGHPPLRMSEDGCSPAMVFELFIERAPLTVKHFMELAASGFYDGLTFHRVVHGYVIQGGSADNTCGCPSDLTIKGEFARNGVDTGLTHERGAISMARDADFDSAGTQFFIVHRDAHKLDGQYAAFGKMREGFEILDAIAAVPTAGPERENRPREPVVIKKILITTGENNFPLLFQ